MHPSSRTAHPRPRAASALKRTRAALLAAAALLVLAACGQPATIDVALDAAGVELLRGSEAAVEVTLTRNGGATGDVELVVTGLPENVEATFDPAVLSGSTLTSTLTFSAAPAALEDHHPVSIAAIGPGLVAKVPMELEVVSLTVTGTFSAYLDLPVQGAAVASQDDTAITDANGEFRLTGLSVPYDVTVWSAGDEWMHVYRGLTTSEPTLTSMVIPVFPATYSTSISGPLTGGVLPVAANQEIRVCAEGLDGTILIGCTVVGPTESSFSLGAQWIGSTTLAVRLHFLQVEYDLGGVPVAYYGYASREVELSNSTPVLFTSPIDLGQALQTKLVDLEIDAAVAVDTTIAAVQVGPNLAISVMTNNDATTAFEIAMPVIPDATYSFASTVGNEQIGWASGTTGESITVVVPEVPTLVAPADLTTGVTTATQFTATNPTGGPMTWFWRDIGSSYAVGLTSMAPTVSIPDTSEHGFALPAGATFTWDVQGSGGDSTESGARAAGDLFNLARLMLFQESPGFVGDGSFAPSDTWDFTTAP